MVAITEKAEWSAQIRQIEEDDPVQGGENGIDNIPHQQLANRTAYLKERLDNLVLPNDHTELIQRLAQRIEQLEQESQQIKGFQIPIGGLFETTVNYQNGDEVATAMGYGQWELYGRGRVTVGLTAIQPISIFDDDTTVKDSAGNTGAFTIGETLGEFSHKLTLDEMPSHSHNTKYRALSVKRGEYDGVAYPISINNNPSEYQEFPTDYAIDNAGGSQAHNNIQPSIVVGRWKRVA